jgi:hypothetical protein
LVPPDSVIVYLFVTSDSRKGVYYTTICMLYTIKYGTTFYIWYICLDHSSHSGLSIFFKSTSTTFDINCVEKLKFHWASELKIVWVMVRDIERIILLLMSQSIKNIMYNAIVWDFDTSKFNCSKNHCLSEDQCMVKSQACL